MSLTQIPTRIDGTPAYRQRVRLDQQDWLIDFVWNHRTQRWAFSLLDLDGSAVLTGQGVACGFNLLNRAQGGPPGQLVAFSTDGTFEAPGLQELGDRVRLIYVSSDDSELLP